MSLIATDECLAELVSNLSEAFSMFSTEAAKLGAPRAFGRTCFA